MKSIKINLMKLSGARVANVRGRTGKKPCLLLPLEDSRLVAGEKGVYLDLMMYETKEPGQYGDVGFLRQSLPREAYEAMGEEARKAMPVLGNVKPVKPRTVAETAEELPPESLEVIDDDLPF